MEFVPKFLDNINPREYDNDNFEKSDSSPNDYELLKAHKNLLEMDNVRLNRELKEANEKISSLISAIENISRHFQ